MCGYLNLDISGASWPRMLEAAMLGSPDSAAFSPWWKALSGICWQERRPRRVEWTRGSESAIHFRCSGMAFWVAGSALGAGIVENKAGCLKKSAFLGQEKEVNSGANLSRSRQWFGLQREVQRAEWTGRDGSERALVASGQGACLEEVTGELSLERNEGGQGHVQEKSFPECCDSKARGQRQGVLGVVQEQQGDLGAPGVREGVDDRRLGG